MLINVHDVMRVYSGTANRCCCGCSGKHTTASRFRELNGKRRGYPVDDDEVSDRSVKIIVGKINKAIMNGGCLPGGNVELGEGYICEDDGHRWRIAYLAD